MTNDFTTHAAWTLAVAFSLSLLYEFYRATVKRGVSKHDSIPAFIKQGIPFYGISGIVIYLLFAGYIWAVWVGIVYVFALILISIFYYNPVILMERKPGLIDWFEDLIYTGLLFAAAAMLIYALSS